MRNSVDIRRLRDHLDILRRERSTAELLIDSLERLKQNAEAEGLDSRVLEEQLQTARAQLRRIRRKIELIDSMADNFAWTTGRVGQTLDDTHAEVKRAGAEY